MPESLEEIATCALYEPTAQREAVLAREIIALRDEMRAEFGLLHERIHGVRDEASTDVHTLAGTVERIAAQLDALESAGARGEVQRLPPGLSVEAHETLVRSENRARSLQQQLDASRVTCPICEHPWQMHDPEDGKCDHATGGGTVFGPCQCGRDLTWMRSHIARLSTVALAATTPTAGGS